VPRKDHILNLPGFTLKKAKESEHRLVLEVEYRGKINCVYCSGVRLRKKASFIRRVHHETMGLRKTILHFMGHKYYCNDCQRYFNGRYPGILKYQRSTERLRTQVAHYHTKGISQKDLARDFRIGTATVERWYQYYYQRLSQELKSRPCPTVLGIDEHFFTRKDGYATTLCDLRRHTIFDVVKGRSGADLHSYLQQLPGKENVKVVCMDLSSTYRKVVKQYFPHAMIVADRFHVIRLLQQHCLQTYQQLSPTLKYHRGLLGALRTLPEHLSARQRQRRDEYFKAHPAIAAVYEFKQQLHQLLMNKHCKARRCKQLIPVFLNGLEQLKNQPFMPLQTLAKTLSHWQEEIVRMWRFTKSNGITEGFHRKMKLIQRRAYGFRNFENYRLRVRVLCG
jgi:transposase